MFRVEFCKEWFSLSCWCVDFSEVCVWSSDSNFYGLRVALIEGREGQRQPARDRQGGVESERGREKERVGERVRGKSSLYHSLLGGNRWVNF